MNFKQISALIISFHLLFNQLLFASSVIIDSTAAKANQASLTKSRSGIDIVNIVTPNSKGLSHNKFSAFSVEKKGLILNNAKKVVNTQLAGAISYNPNLKSHAKLILNEVTGTNKTFLRGYTEIAGRTTDLIIANPNGITVNGGGFINTNKATLTTGVPQFKDGFLNGFNIHKGSIFIEGQGFNAFNINRVNLYSKYLTLNAKFHAKHAEVITGENNIDLNGNITSHNKTDSGIAIDSSLLGGIYVDSIRLSSTDKGVGVNLPPEVFAQDSLYLNANGDITIDMIEAGNGIDIESQTNSITSSTLHANNIRLKAKENITNEELIRANHTVTIDAKKVYNKNAILAGVNKQLEFDVLTQTHSSINITAEELDNTNATVLSKENVTINATDVDNTDGKISARKNLTIHASIQGDNAQYIAYETMNLGSSSVQGDNSQFFAKDIIFTADDIAITNSIVSATNNVLIDSNTELTLQEGNLFEAANDVSIESIGLINRALILSHNTLNLDISGDMTNEASGIIKGKTTSVFNVNELTNKGLISSSLNTNIKANAIENYGGIAVSNQSNIAGTLTLKANDLTNYNTIYSNGYAHFYILNELLNQTNENKVSGVDRARITVQKELTIQGNEDKTLRTQIITNHKGIIETKEGDITLYAQDIVNKNDDVEVSKDVINETWNLVSSDGRYFGTKSQDRTYNIGGDDSGASTPYVIHAYLEGSTDLHTKYALPYLTTKKQRGITSDSLYGSFNVIINDCDMDSCREETLFTYVNGKKYNPYTIMQQYNNNVYNELVDTFEHFDLEIKRVEEGTTFMNHEQYLSYLHRKADYWTQDEPFFASPINPKMNRFLFDLGFVNFNRYELKKRSGGGRQYLNLSIYQEKEKLSKPIDTNKQAILTSAKNLNIDSINLTNTLSHISAQKDIILTDGINVTNKAITLHHKKRRYGRDKRGVLISELTIDNGHGEIIDQINSSIEAGGTIKGKPNSLENDSGVKENTNISVTTENIDNTYTNTKLDEKTSQKEIELPTNKFGKFIIADVNEGHDYVVQSNPLYTSVDSFTGSDYFLEKMGLKKNLIKRLGDAEYETHMVQNAILEKAGKRFLKQAKSANEQYIDLMNQALVEKDILGLQVGQALSQEQLANLNQDIVWMEEKEVNGIKVLVPVVYLASDYSNKGASIIAGKDIDLEINSDVKNTGQLIAKENLSLKARSLLNQNASIQAGQTAIIETQGNIANKAGGNIKAGSLGLTSNEGSIINDTYVRKTTVGTRKANTTYTIVGKQSSIESTRGNLVLKAKQNINNNASIIKAKGSLGAYTQEGNINITTKELEDASYSKRGSNKDKYKKIRHLQSNISAGENIALNSGDDLNIVASSLNAKKDVHLKAEKNINVLAVNNLDYREKKRKSKGSFGSSSSSHKINYKERVVSADIRGENILLDSQKDITLEAAKLNAKENITAQAKGNINVVAKQYKEGYMKFKSSSGFGGLSSKASMDKKDFLKLKSATLDAQAKNIVFKSGDSINLLASQISALNGGVTLEAANDILIAAGKEMQAEEKWSKESSFLKDFFKDGSLFSMEYDLEKKGQTTAKSSQIDSKNLSIKSGNDTHVQGSNLNTSESTTINTGGEYKQTSVAEEFYEYKKHKEAKVKFNLKVAQDFAKGIWNNLKANLTSEGFKASSARAFGSADPGMTMIMGDTSVNLFKVDVHNSSYDNKSTVQKASNINSGDKVNITSEKNIQVTASNINAQGDINLSAKEDINIQAGLNHNENEEKRLDAEVYVGINSAGLDMSADFEKDKFKNYNETAVSSNVSTNANLNIDANNVLIEGSNVDVKENLNATVDNDFEVKAATNSSGKYIKTFEFHSQTGGDSGTELKDGKIVMEMGSASVDKFKKTVDETTKTSSNINVGENINIQSGNDIKVEGSNIKAGEDMTLTAGNDIDIKEAKEEIYEKSEEFHGEATVSVEVKHQAIEIVKATNALNKAKKQAEQAKDDYKQYKKDLKTFQTQLDVMQEEYAAKTPGITKADIEEFKDIIQDLKSDENWYKTSIALSEANVATQSLYLVQQVVGAARSVSSYAWGFDAGVNLNIDTVLEKAKVYASSSVSSNLEAKNITLTANNNVNVQGSNVVAQDNLDVNAKEVNVLASRDKSSNDLNREHTNLNLNYSIFAGFSVSAAYDRFENRNKVTNYTNSVFNANNINITTEQDMNVKGANVIADDVLNLDIGNDLNIVAVQNRYRNDSKSLGFNVGYSAGSDSSSGSGGSIGFNQGNSKYREKQTVNTTVVGKKVNANVENETYLQGGMLASLDENGQDNYNLNLTTNTLKYEDLSNTTYSNNKSIGGSVSWSTKENTEKGKEGETYKSADSSSVQYSNGVNISKDKTLSTLGQGDIEVKDEENSDDLERLNRDVTKVTKEIYDVNLQKGNIDVSLDHRLLTKDGRKKIKEDFDRQGLLFGVITDVLTKDSVELEDTFQHMDIVNTNYDINKELVALEGGKYANIIKNLENATLSEKQEAVNVYTQLFAREYGLTLSEAKIIVVNSLFKGAIAHSRDIFFNDSANATPEELQATINHELAHALTGQGFVEDKGSTELNEEYADLLGEYGARNFNSNYDNADLDSTVNENYNISKVNQLGLVKKNNDEFIFKITTQKEHVDFAITPETVFDLVSLYLGMNSLTKNLQEGKYKAAFVDGIGVVIDTGAAIIPIVPGGAGVSIKAYRNMDEAMHGAKLQIADKALGRNKQGIVSSNVNSLPIIKDGDTWLKGTNANAGKIPKQIAEKLNGKSYENFSEFRSAFWKEVANDPILSKQFDTDNFYRMKNGYAPEATKFEQVGKRVKYELDHNIEIQNGGNVYDLNNIIIRTPNNHIKKTSDTKKANKNE